MDKEFLDKLCCPACKSDVFVDPAQAGRMVCKACRRRYPIREGIPVMLIEEAEVRQICGSDELTTGPNGRVT